MAVKEYIFAKTVSDITQKLTDTSLSSQLIAGGVGIAGQRKNGFLDCDLLIDISRVPELIQAEKVQINGSQYLKLGAAVSLSRAAKLEELQSAFPLLQRALQESSDPARRNAYTLGGRLASKVPVGMLFPALCALGAVVEIQYGDAVEQIPVADWFTTYYAEDPYLIRAILIPYLPAPSFAMLDVKRRNYPGEIVAGALVVHDAAKSYLRAYGSVDNFGLVIFEDFAEYLKDNTLTREASLQVSNLVTRQLQNSWGSDDDTNYRRNVLAALVVRCVNQLFL